MDLAQCGGIARIVEREELDPVIAEAALLPGQIDAIFPVGDVGGHFLSDPGDKEEFARRSGKDRLRLAELLEETAHSDRPDIREQIQSQVCLGRGKHSFS